MTNEIIAVIVYFSGIFVSSFLHSIFYEKEDFLDNPFLFLIWPIVLIFMSFVFVFGFIPYLLANFVKKVINR